MFSVSYSLQRKGKTLLNYFPSPHFSPPRRSFPHHQQSHPENQFAQEAGLFNPRRGGRLLHHPPVALHFPLTRPPLSRKTEDIHFKKERKKCPFLSSLSVFMTPFKELMSERKISLIGN